LYLKFIKWSASWTLPLAHLFLYVCFWERLSGTLHGMEWNAPSSYLYLLSFWDYKHISTHPVHNIFIVMIIYIYTEYFPFHYSTMKQWTFPRWNCSNLIRYYFLHLRAIFSWRITYNLKSFWLHCHRSRQILEIMPCLYKIPSTSSFLVLKNNVTKGDSVINGCPNSCCSKESFHLCILGNQKVPTSGYF
jgi:hypothetical protein